MKQYKVGDEIKVYEVINRGGFIVDYTGQQIASNSEGNGWVRLIVDSGAAKNLAYLVPLEAKHVCTMRITKLKNLVEIKGIGTIDFNPYQAKVLTPPKDL